MRAFFLSNLLFDTYYSALPVILRRSSLFNFNVNKQAINLLILSFPKKAINI